MTSENVQGLPKMLCVILKELLNDQDLIHWSMNSNNTVTSVVLRFSQPGHVGEVPVTWRKSPAQLKRDNSRAYNYTHQQYQGSQYASVQRCHNVESDPGISNLGGYGSVVCDTNNFSTYVTTPTSAPLHHTPGLTCEPQVLTPMLSESDTKTETMSEECPHVNTGSEVNITSYGCQSHDIADNKDSESETSVSSPEKICLTGTKEDFTKVVQDWRNCEKVAFLRGLVKDNTIVEIEIGTKGPLRMINENDPDYEELRSHINSRKNSGWDMGFWQPTADCMIELWKMYIQEDSVIK